MIIKSLKQHFPARFSEWLNAGIMIAWGCYVILNPELFTDPRLRPALGGMADMAPSWLGDPAAVWGLGALLIGTIRAAALLVNGYYIRTPIVRVVACFASAFVWTQMVLALAKTDLPLPSIVVYGGLVFADIFSAYRAAKDAAYAEHARREVKEMKRRACDDS